MEKSQRCLRSFILGKPETACAINQNMQVTRSFCFWSQSNKFVLARADFKVQVGQTGKAIIMQLKWILQIRDRNINPRIAKTGWNPEKEEIPL